MTRILLSFYLVLLVLSACRNDLNEVNRLTQEKAVPLSSTRNVEMLYSDSARLRARINAPLRHTFMGEEHYVEFPEGLKVEFYDGEEIESTVTANYAISYSKTEQMEARNKVVIINSEGEKLETEHLIWDRRNDRIYTDQFCTITSPTKIIYGDGLEAQGDFSKYKIRNIRGTVNLNE